MVKGYDLASGSCDLVQRGWRIACICCGGNLFLTHQYCCRRFDANQWKQAGQGTDMQITKNEMDCVRGRMIHDLRWMHLKRGMSKEELVSLLGPFTQSIRDRENNCISYSVGYCGGMGFDLNGITFCFDADQHLMNALGEIRR
jgi:hypothetical protein